MVSEKLAGREGIATPMITPYYEEPGITIYCADCLTALNHVEQPVAAIITDVPFASGARTEAAKPSSGAMLRGERWASKPIENDQMTTTGFIWMIREVCYAVRPILRDGGSFLTFIDWRQWPNLVGAIESTNLRVNQMIVWDKYSYGLGHGFRSQHELICHASKGTPSIFSHDTGNVLRARRDDNSDHPTPKPAELLEDLIKTVSASGDLILDPFMGSGTTLVAAKQLGRRAIGIEIERKYCDIAIERLRQEVLPLAAPVVEAAEQLELISTV